MVEKFPTNKAIHLKGSKLLQCLKLDRLRRCFTYTDPISKQIFECEGVVQVKIGLQWGQDLNQLPFLPVRDGLKTFRPLCGSCLKLRYKGECFHFSLNERSWRGVYSMAEVVYAVLELSYELSAIEEALCYTTQDYIFKDYFKLLSIEKIKHQPLLPGACPTIHCETINSEMRLTHPLEKLQPEMLKPNKAAVAFAKSLMNFSLGTVIGKNVVSTVRGCFSIFG